ncbi:hypothetical protein DPMN_102117 [Dreissena polymorpha]|uniref:Uncharacterized protein n=1 Tax=Dreissena polymorpha TaxID=45954 RepID=A0A9D4RAB2_DREPO|nr:hypothetical protein DPMN_102117 [Dreissena polymorpha]
MQRTEFHDIRSIFATEYKHYEKRDGVWMDVKRVNKSLDKALVYAEYNKSVSNTIVVSLQEFDNECGHLSVFEFPKKIGDTARIAYYPTQDILDREQDFHRAWRTALGVIKLKRGAFEEKDVSLNRHFILSIFNITERTEYSLECKRTRSLPRTKSVSVFVGNPVLGPLCSLDGCVNCVCVNPGESV